MPFERTESQLRDSHKAAGLPAGTTMSPAMDYRLIEAVRTQRRFLVTTHRVSFDSIEHRELPCAGLLGCRERCEEETTASVGNVHGGVKVQVTDNTGWIVEIGARGLGYRPRLPEDSTGAVLVKISGRQAGSDPGGPSSSPDRGRRGPDGG
jgi:hypothetical protein